jgi:parvulin-like peptidyl-prolyl isomerase
MLAFGVLLTILFVMLAITEGIGDPSIPSGDVILVQDVPEEGGEISKEEFDHALYLGAKGEGLDKAPKPGDDKYEELKEGTLSTLLQAAWIEGQAAEMGITVSDEEVDKELKKLKKANFKTDAEFEKFIKESGFTSKDLDERVKLQILTEEIQNALKEEPPTPSESEIENYYEAAKATQFTKPASADVRLILNKDEEKAQKALTALRKDNSGKSWSRVAKEFSDDPTTKENGGLQSGVTEGTLEEPLNAEIFNGPERELLGPLKTAQGYYVFEVQTVTPESTQDLKEVESQIKATLAGEAEQANFAAFVANFNSRWTSRSFCAPDYTVELCANFKSSGHPETAPPGCYEANPKGGRPDACPAPVFQLVPALPGTVTPLERQGKPLAQRPQPEGLKPPEEGAASEAIPGAIPTTP